MSHAQLSPKPNGLGASSADLLLSEALASLSVAMEYWYLVWPQYQQAESSTAAVVCAGTLDASYAATLQSASQGFCRAASYAVEAAQIYAHRCQAAAQAASGAKLCPGLDLSGEQAQGSPWGVVWNGQAYCLDSVLVAQVVQQMQQAQASVAAAQTARSVACPRVPIRARVSPFRLAGAPNRREGVGAFIDSSGNFTADAALSAAEQAAADKLAEALSTALQEEGESAGVAAAFVAGMIGGDAAITALTSGAGVVAAAAAGVAAGEAAVATATTVISAAAPLALAVFAVPLILEALWGASPGPGCCGYPPDPKQHWAVNGIALPDGVDASAFPGAYFETTAQATARAVAYAKEKNSDASCAGNFMYPPWFFSPWPSGPHFYDYACVLIDRAVTEAQWFKCWPLAQINLGKLLAVALKSWNDSHAGPETPLNVTFASENVTRPDPFAYALLQAIPPNGTITVSSGQTSGFTNYQVPTWDGQTTKTVTFHVNTGAVITPGAHPSGGAAPSNALAKIAIGTATAVGVAAAGLGVYSYVTKQRYLCVLNSLWSETKTGARTSVRKVKGVFRR